MHSARSPAGRASYRGVRRRAGGRSDSLGPPSVYQVDIGCIVAADGRMCTEQCCFAADFYALFCSGLWLLILQIWFATQASSRPKLARRNRAIGRCRQTSIRAQPVDAGVTPPPVCTGMELTQKYIE